MVVPKQVIIVATAILALVLLAVGMTRSLGQPQEQEWEYDEGTGVFTFTVPLDEHSFVYTSPHDAEAYYVSEKGYRINQDKLDALLERMYEEQKRDNVWLSVTKEW